MGGPDTDLETFAGRGYELGVLDECLAAARRGEGRLVHLTGEAGIGKTRFCRQVASRAGRAGMAVAWGRCWIDGGAPPLWPWRQVLTDLGDHASAGLCTQDGGGATVDPKRFARFATITDRLAATCTDTPALVVIDDAHAADAGTMLLARYVARVVNRLRLVLVLARRTGADLEAAAGPAWSIESDATVVALDRFSPADTAAFVRAHGETDVDGDLLQALQRLTGGHPLYLLRMITAGRAGATAGPTRPVVRPTTVRAAITENVHRLDTSARHVLGVAALLPAPVDLTEAAAVSQVSRSRLERAVGAAVPAGLVQVDGSGQFSFTHELVREVLADRLTSDERADAHTRAADVLARPGPATVDRLTRRAHHALRAAHRSADRARAAVDACRGAARAMVERLDNEQAAALLAEAVAVQDRAGLGGPHAPVLLEWAEAVLLCGRLAEARPIFDRAVRTATAEGDPVLLAKATLGLGGIWINEHRTRLDWERVIGLQRRALAGLPAGQDKLRHRLTVRLAAEAVYRGGPVEPVLAALRQARRSGDPHVLAEALSLCHHALLTPRYTKERLALADELIAVAAPAGAAMHATVGLCWRTVDLFHLGDPRAITSLAELRERAGNAGCLSALYVVSAMEVMLLIRAGKLDEAEAKATSTYELGTRVGDADALGYYGVHLTTIRWLQGRAGEMQATVEQIADSPTLNPAEFGFQATAAYLAALAGRSDEARIILDRLTGTGLAKLPESSTWLAAMQAIVESARLLDDAGLARQAYDLLTPYADLPIMPSLAVTCFGSTHRVLGVAALTFGDHQRAAGHFDDALRANRLLGNRPATAITLAGLAEVLALHGTGHDRTRARDLFTEARDAAESMGMRQLSTACERRLAEIASRTATITRANGHWVLAAGERRAVVPDRLGLHYLATLLTSPGRPVAALHLAADGAGAPAVGAAAQPVLDQRARAAYRRRVASLTAELGQAQERGDGRAQRRLRGELDFLLDELRQATGRGGRTRAFADSRERARTAVQKAIKRAITEIGGIEPVIGASLATTVTTGTLCCYTPDADQPVRWTYADRR